MSKWKVTRVWYVDAENYWGALVGARVWGECSEVSATTIETGEEEMERDSANEG